MEKIFRYLYTAPQARIGSFLIGKSLKITLSISSLIYHRLINFDYYLQKGFVILEVNWKLKVNNTILGED